MEYAIGIGVLASSIGLASTGSAQSVAEQTAYLKPSPSVSSAMTGNCVAIDGTTLVVGAIDDWSGAVRGGAAYVYERQGDAWALQQKLVAPNPTDPDFFGTSVAIDGDRIVVGATLEDSIVPGSGAAFVYDRVGAAWNYAATLKASNAEQSDYFGFSVDLVGDSIVVGAFREDSSASGINGDDSNNSAGGSGAAYLFELVGGAWVQTHYIKASNTGTSGGSFGWSVALSDERLAVGARFEPSGSDGVNGNQADTSAAGAGAVYVFDRTGGNLVQEAYIKASNSSAQAWFGWDIALEGDLLAVGAPGQSLNQTCVGGLGPPTQYPPWFPLFESGAAYLFERVNGTWTEQLYLKAVNAFPYHDFGSAVAVSADRLIVGAEGEAIADAGVADVAPPYVMVPVGDFGAVHVFEREAGVWDQTSYLKPEHPDAGDLFGASLALQDDRLYVGAYGEDSLATGVNGDQTNDGGFDVGAAYEFDLDGPDASVTSSTLGGNVVSYSATLPTLGSTWQASVDLSLTGHLAAVLVFFRQPALLGPILGDQWLLVGPSFPAGELFDLPPLVGTPNAQLAVPIPAAPSLAGWTLHSQAVHVGGVAPLALSNALELRLGN